MPQRSSSRHPKARRPRRERRLSIRSVRRDEPDLERIAAGIAGLVIYLAETNQELSGYHAAVA